MSDFKVPQFEIRFLVGNEHVGASNQSIASLIGARCEKAGMTEKQIAQCVNYAIGVHAENRELYDFVMRGSTKRKKTTNGSN
jgi:hypothetical protein